VKNKIKVKGVLDSAQVEMDVRVSKVVSNNNSSGAIKHIDIKYFIVKDKVEHIKYQANACGYANLKVTTQYFIIT
jgi:hypothetical protein